MFEMRSSLIPLCSGALTHLEVDGGQMTVS